MVALTTGKHDRTSLLTLTFATNVGGIYACFMCTSLLHEYIYRARDTSGETLSPWFVNVLEALANVFVGAVGVYLWEKPLPPPQRALALAGCAQVVSKSLASMSRVHGVPGPVSTMAKSSKALPIMAGQWILAGTRYTWSEYIQYSMIVSASILIGTAKSSLPTDHISLLGCFYLAGSMFCDGYVGGVQKQMKMNVKVHRKARGIEPASIQPFEMQLYTNLYMLGTAMIVAIGTGALHHGYVFCRDIPSVTIRVAQYAFCSAIGQIFVFNTVTAFDPLILSIVTTSRKFFSLIVTLIVFGYDLNGLCIAGIVLAGIGLSLVLFGEISASSSCHAPVKLQSVTEDKPSK